MRWLILALAGLVALSVGLTWVHPAAKTVGRELAEAMEGGKEAGELRGAVAVVEYGPEESLVAGVRGEKVRRGEALMPGEGLLTEGVNSHWAAWEDARFTWRAGTGTGGATVERLRAAVAERSAGEGGWERVRRGLGKIGFSMQTSERAMREAAAALAGLSDADLLAAWLRADRAVLVQTEDLAEAVREALLLAASPERGPVLTFHWAGVEVFALALPSDGNVQWVELAAYGTDKHLAWTGTLRVEGKGGAMPDSARVRLLMARAAEEASTLPGGLQGGQ